MGAIPPETLICAKSLEEEQIQFKQNLCSLNNYLLYYERRISDKTNFQKLELFPSNHYTLS